MFVNITGVNIYNRINFKPLSVYIPDGGFYADCTACDDPNDGDNQTSTTTTNYKRGRT